MTQQELDRVREILWRHTPLDFGDNVEIFLNEVQRELVKEEAHHA